MQKNMTPLLYLLTIHHIGMAQGQLYCLKVAAHHRPGRSCVVHKSKERFLGQPIVVLKHRSVAWEMGNHHPGATKPMICTGLLKNAGLVNTLDYPGT